jgi:phosphatidylserine/phosphatidylglycerophosphate/cardiolipin synthase-like enzyme
MRMARLTIVFSWKLLAGALIGLLVLLLLIPHFLHRRLPFPPGFEVKSLPTPTHPDGINLQVDSTFQDRSSEKRIIRQTIFDDILSMIKRADRFIYIDMFLWNPWKGSVPESYRALSTELARALIEKKRRLPGIDILVLTDPINRIYGQHEPAYFSDMADAGIPVVFTPLKHLPDSNRFYAAYWNLAERFLLDLPLIQRFTDRPMLDNPFEIGGPRISLRQFGRMLLFKANHRKVVITGSSTPSLEMAVGSLNPADGSSAHSNLSLNVAGRAAYEALRTELDLALWAAGQNHSIQNGMRAETIRAIANIQRAAVALTQGMGTGSHPATVQWLTEGSIADRLLDILSGTERGDEIRIAMFYLSDRGIIGALRDAALKGGKLRIILDANRDAFGMRKIGIPNRQVAAELMTLSDKADIQIRWADTHGEQFHTKAVSISNERTGKSILLAGSANWTKRNLRNLNLEANLLIEGAPKIVGQYNGYFEGAWSNSDGLGYTLPFETWEETGWTLWWKTRLYRFQEWSGMCTF